MKYLKKFENRIDKKYTDKSYYWLVPTDDRFEDSMKKIGCPSDFIFNKLESGFSRYKYVLISHIGYDLVPKKPQENSNNRWGWNEYKGNIPDVFYSSIGYEFAGYVNMTEYELDIIKYNL